MMDGDEDPDYDDECDLIAAVTELNIYIVILRSYRSIVQKLFGYCTLWIFACNFCNSFNSDLSDMAEIASFSPPAWESTVEYRTSPLRQACMRPKLKAAPVYI